MDDYRAVAIDTLEDMKARPIKSSVYISLITTAVALLKTNPGEREFHSRLTEHVTELTLVGDRIRNPKSEATVNQLAQYANDGRLKCYNIGFCTLMCLQSYSSEVNVYSAHCKYTEPHWMEFHKTIIDVGVFGRWRKLEEAMKDFDINPDEWQADGQPNKNYKHYKSNLVSWDMKLK